MDYDTLEGLRRLHPAWRLLRSEYAALIGSFLHRTFIQGSQRAIGASDLTGRLEDELYHLRESLGPDAFPRSAAFYLDEWCEEDKGWLRKFYPPGSIESFYDLTPATEKVLLWMEGLLERNFLGTESRVRTVVELLKQVVLGTETDPEKRLAELEFRKKAIEEEMDRVRRGDFQVMDGTAIRDRFSQAVSTARELLADFRGVEENFRKLDRQARELITQWDGAKGSLVGQLLDQRQAISESDQGKNFRSFWDFLMDPQRQEELDKLLGQVYDLKEVQTLEPDPRGRKIHYAWMDAGEQTQRTVALLSQELRRFLDDQAWLENRRIMEILKGLEQNALALRTGPLPSGTFMEIDAMGPEISLPMDRPLYIPRVAGVLAQTVVEEGALEESWALYNLKVVDRQRLLDQIRKFLESRVQGSLEELVQEFPIKEGLAEVVTYFDLEGPGWESAVDDQVQDTLDLVDAWNRSRKITLPRIIFRRR